MKRVAFLIIGVFLWTGCSMEDYTNESLAIVELGYKTGPKLVYLANDYGFLIYWSDTEKPELYLYDKPANKIEMTSDFSVFLSGFQRFPNSVKLDRIRGCGITAAGMPEEYKGKLNDIIKAKGFRLTNTDDGNFTVCSCEATYVRRFTTTNSRIK